MDGKVSLLAAYRIYLEFPLSLGLYYTIEAA